MTIFTGETGNIDIDFEAAELHCWDTGLVVSLNAEQLTSYRKFIADFSKQVFSDHEKYTSSYPPDVLGNETERFWSLIVTYDNGTERRLDANVQAFPDEWNDFVEKTNALIGYDFLKKN